MRLISTNEFLNMVVVTERISYEEAQISENMLQNNTIPKNFIDNQKNRIMRRYNLSKNEVRKI